MKKQNAYATTSTTAIRRRSHHLIKGGRSRAAAWKVMIHVALASLIAVRSSQLGYPVRADVGELAMVFLKVLILSRELAALALNAVHAR